MWSNLRPARGRRLLSPGRGLAPALAAALAVSAAGGCGGPTGNFYVVQNQVPNAGCTVAASESARYLGQGTLDVRATSGEGYVLLPLLKNDLPAEGGGGVQPNRIALSGFEVDVKVIDGPTAAVDMLNALGTDPSTAALMRYQQSWSGSVDPGGGTTAAATIAFPAEAARLLRDGKVLANGSAMRVEIQVRATGRTLGGSIKSDPFTYPLYLCDGCLINSVSACPATAPVLQGGLCNPGQDAPVDCCSDGSALICPATSAP